MQPPPLAVLSLFISSEQKLSNNITHTSWSE